SGSSFLPAPPWSSVAPASPWPTKPLFSPQPCKAVASPWPSRPPVSPCLSVSLAPPGSPPPMALSPSVVPLVSSNLHHVFSLPRFHHGPTYCLDSSSLPGSSCVWLLCHCLPGLSMLPTY
ncbi:hypothetical protein M9458_002927, partial [Cirrhinus mrigala]